MFRGTRVWGPASMAGLRWSVLCAVLAWFSVPTLISLNEQWLGSAYYSHGYVVLILTVALVIRELKNAPLEPLATSVPGLVCLVVTVVGTVAAYAGSTELVAEVLFPRVPDYGHLGVGGVETQADSLPPSHTSISRFHGGTRSIPHCKGGLWMWSRRG